MIRHAIDLGGGFSVMPVFEQYSTSRLTPTGFQPTVTTKCILFDAKGLEVLGVGYSIKSPDDAPDEEKAVKLALGRALKHAQQYASRPEVFITDCDKDKIFAALLKEIRRQYQEQDVEQYRLNAPPPTQKLGSIVDIEVLPLAMR